MAHSPGSCIQGGPDCRLPSSTAATFRIKVWAPVHEVESVALDQLKRTASLPWVFHHVAAMPDVHFGKGATVGSVIAMKGAVSPAAVGVDIGCGMGAVRTILRADDLPDSLNRLRARDRGGHPGRLQRARRAGVQARDARGDRARRTEAVLRVRRPDAEGARPAEHGQAAGRARWAAATTSSRSAAAATTRLADAALGLAQHRQGAGRDPHRGGQAARAQRASCPTATWPSSWPARRRWPPTATTCSGRSATRS